MNLGPVFDVKNFNCGAVEDEQCFPHINNHLNLLCRPHFSTNFDTKSALPIG